MDSIKELFDVIKGRLASPLFRSFIFFWLIFNWPIPVILLFYKQNEYLIKGKGVSFIDAINNQINVYNNLLIPLSFATAYVFIYPWVKAKIDEYNVTVSAASEDKIIKITKTNSMPMSKYLSKLKKLDDKEKELELIGVEKSELNAVITELEGTINGNNEIIEKLEERNRTLNNIHSHFQNVNSLNFLDGIWAIKYQTSDEKFNEVWTFKDKEVFQDSNKKIYKIDTINGNPEARTTFLYLKGQSRPDLLLKLTAIDSRGEYLEGRDGLGKLYEFVKQGALLPDF